MECLLEEYLDIGTVASVNKRHLKYRRVDETG